MSLTTFLQSMAVGDRTHEDVPTNARNDGSTAFGIVFSDNARSAFLSILQQTRPQLLVYLQNGTPSDALCDIAVHVENAGMTGCHVLVLPIEGHFEIGAVAELLRKHEVSIDALVFDPGLGVSDLSPWSYAVHTLMHSSGWLFGAHLWDVEKLTLIEDMAQRERFNLTFTADIWLATAKVGLVPPLLFPLIGALETVRFGTIADSTDEVHSKDAFLNCLSNGVSSYMRFGGGETFSNPLPINVLQQSQESQDRFTSSFFPQYEETLQSEGHQIAYMRDLRVAGGKGYAYSRHGQLLETSIGTGIASVKAIKEIIPAYEPIIRSTTTTVENVQMPGMAGIFPRAVEINGPHVVVMWPDIFCYQHWLIGCLPRFWYLDEFPEFATLPIVMNSLDRRFQLEYLQMLGVLEKTRLVHFNHSVSLRIKEAIYPSHFEAPMHSPGVIAWLRNRFLKHAAKLPNGYEGGLYYISRKDGRGRGIVNENEIIDYLLPRGFQIILWSEYSVAEQIALANHAKVIIGAHGSNMSNTLYVNSGCKIMSLCTVGVGHEGYDLNLAFGPQTVGAKSYFLIGQPMPGPISIADYHINFEEFKTVFSEMMDG